MKSLVKKDKTEIYLFAENENDKVTLQRLWDENLILGAYLYYKGEGVPPEQMQLYPTALSCILINNTIGWVQKKEKAQQLNLIS